MRANQNFFYGTADNERKVHGGEVFDEKDAVVRSFPDFFDPVYETVSNPAPVKRVQRRG